MGKRLTAIVTKTGDAGTTGLATGERVSKACLRMMAIGDVDELNSQIGLLLCNVSDDATKVMLSDIQQQLFNLGGELAMPSMHVLDATSLLWLEETIEKINQALPPLQEFILPAGSRSACHAHVCRSVARRAERSIVALHHTEPLRENLLKFANRLSDFFFVLARQLNRNQLGVEIYWKSKKLSE